MNKLAVARELVKIVATITGETLDPSMGSGDIKNVDISRIIPGDLVLHDDKLRTVTRPNIHNVPGIGRTLFGDSYNLGYKKVKRVDNFRK